jgi:pyrimidine operon attenuation protein/uracil phosphoribosyltransferase
MPGMISSEMSTHVMPLSPQIVQKAQLMTASDMERTITRMAYQMVESHHGADQLVLVGIKRRGVPLAQRLSEAINRIEKKSLKVGALDISLYRDDLSTFGPKPIVREGELDVEIDGKAVVLVDDVLYTGRTVRAAIDAIFQHGRPAQIQLCVLIDRGHRELPIEAAFIGRTVQTTQQEIIEVKLQEIDNAEKVLLMEKVS